MAKPEGGETDFAATIELLWGMPKPKTRGPKPAHSLEDLLDAAIGIADREGLEAVSMQRVAQELSFTKMAVYRYVPGRPELIALMTDRGLGPPPALPVKQGWRKQLEAWALGAYEVFLMHPWGLQSTAGRRVIGPNEAAWTEAGLGALAETKLSGPDRLDVLAVTLGHLRSAAQQVTAARRDGTSGEADMETFFLAALRGREQGFPELTRAIAETAAVAGANNGLSFGLNCIFDGIEWRLSKARSGKRV